MTITLESPFWKVMSYIMAGLVSGAIFIAVTALNKLDKVSDAQIETKTMLSILIAQQEKNGTILSDNVSNVNQINIRLAKMDAFIQAYRQDKGLD